MKIYSNTWTNGLSPVAAINFARDRLDQVAGVLEKSGGTIELEWSQPPEERWNLAEQAMEYRHGYEAVLTVRVRFNSGSGEWRPLVGSGN